MKIGIIGLGRMGNAIAYRLIKYGYEVWGFDSDGKNSKLASADGVKTVTTLQDITHYINIFWLMVPAGEIVDSVINALIPNLKQGDIIIDGGNSNFKDTVRRYQNLISQKINYIDCGTSGGLHGRDIGFSLMIGGDKKVFESLEPIFKSIAAPQGYAYMGPSGAGHYVKMIHNGIEYALLQSYAEGFHLLKDGAYKDLDLEKISDVWNHGSIIRSWILELAQNVFAQDQNLTEISGKIGENKTGRWTLDEAKEQNIPVDLIERSLEIRAHSRQDGGNYATKVVAMLRNQFGGHAIEKKS
ncbi:MAG: decarboxylating 6-phosphogluconate dehydrogenase [bacterium]